MGLTQGAEAAGHHSDQIQTWTDLYGRVCDTYLAVDDFRMKLLGLLPVATSGGVFILLNTNAEQISNSDTAATPPLLAIGLFGLLFTLGLFSYELFGIKRCHYLIATGQRLERNLHARGQFRSRPAELAGLVNEPFAASVIYPSCMGAWVFLALVSWSTVGALVVALVVTFLSFGATLCGLGRMKSNAQREMCVVDILAADKAVDLEELRKRAKERWELMLNSGSEPDRGSEQDRESSHDWVERIVRRLREDGEIETTDGPVKLAGPTSE